MTTLHRDKRPYRLLGGAVASRPIVNFLVIFEKKVRWGECKCEEWVIVLICFALREGIPVAAFVSVCSH
jgi:hypothetical protein